MNLRILTCLALLALAPAAPLFAQDSVLVTPDNFTRAESDLFFRNVVEEGNLGKLFFHREPAQVDRQAVIRLNRDTLYGSGVFDLDAGPVTLTLPDAGDRFRSVQVIDEDQYTHQVIYDAGSTTFTREAIGTRYLLLGVRILVDPGSPADLDAVHTLQDATIVSQPGGPGTFETPNWDKDSQAKVRAALLELAATLPDTRNSFGAKGTVDPVRFLIQSAAAWGGNPDQDALYLSVTPEQNDGKAVYRLKVGTVPVDGFWSISVYNTKGYFEPNAQNAYTLNNITAKKGEEGSVTIQFGGCDDDVINCIPTLNGWNYLVRLYRPQAAILDGNWTFPAPEMVK